MVQIDIEAGGVTYNRTINPEDLTLGFLEDVETAQSTGKWRDLIPAFASLLDIPRDAARQLRISQFRAIAGALSQASAVPNDSAPLSA